MTQKVYIVIPKITNINKLRKLRHDKLKFVTDEE